ncbi:HNH endonuclease [Anaeromyxobacter terrae]|uniref:HNH endonuclease n=1 Tax=Anaeromyxobacter terrae TaxID=2925406 RepID=UPI001F55CF03|nr:HNH endonuclease [Anaeromyxobacter sp. SG22]
MRGFVANTDLEWFTFLRERQPLDEVNFWQPSGHDAFRALQPGEPLLFRLKSPINAIAGFGLFARHEIVPAWLAWESFELRNGAPDYDTMCHRIERYRHGQPADPHRQYRIGCIMLSQPLFFADGDWVPEPVDWPRNTVRGKGYDLAEGEGRRVWEDCLARLRSRAAPLAAEPVVVTGAERFGAPQIVLPRLGQGTFRVAVTQAYGACAVTGEHSLPVLEAAHVQPFSKGGSHEVRNGLLLRTDIHRLFDRGYVTVTPELRFEVSDRLKAEYDNGKAYYALHGSRIHIPGRDTDRPDPRQLRWHNENVYERGIAA